MAVVELNLDSLRVLDDGRIKAAWEQELRHAMIDLEDRPGDDRERSVTLKLSLKPVTDETGHCELVDVQAQIGAKLPSRKSKIYSMKPRKSKGGPMLVFNEDNLDNANQSTLPFDGDE